VKYRRLWWVGHVARIGRQLLDVQNVGRKLPLGISRNVGRIILKRTLGNKVVCMGHETASGYLSIAVCVLLHFDWSDETRDFDY
jgi:hypothetical protein